MHATGEAVAILALTLALPYVAMGLIHLHLSNFKSQRIVSFLASVICCVVGVGISSTYLMTPIGATSPGMGVGYFLIAVYAGVVALVALVVCAFIQRAHHHAQRADAV